MVDDFVTQMDFNGNGTVYPPGGSVCGSVGDWDRTHQRQIQIGFKKSAWWIGVCGNKGIFSFKNNSH